jgi:uridine kinase
MTDDTTNTKIDIDGAQLRELIRQYRAASDREEQRQIEDQVLQETVWQVPSESSEDGASLSKEEFEQVYSELPEDAKHARRILRTLHFRGL